MPKDKIVQLAKNAINSLYNKEIDYGQLVVQPTRSGIEGDFTLVVFPITKVSGKNPVDTANDIGKYIVSHTDIFTSFNVIKGFLNFSLRKTFWTSFINNEACDNNFGFAKEKSGKKILIEFSSPNTNKPLHLGHVRNNLLGVAVSNILSAAGHDVIKVNLVNDRGIHICKSMLAWQKWGNGITPKTAGVKGDHLVGDFYVKFNEYYKQQIDNLIANGMDKKQAEEESSLMKEAHNMLKKWESGDEEVKKLWTMMNSWVYSGFDETYKRLGVDFDKIFYESQTYLLGKQNVYDALDKGILVRDEDNSVWIDLTADGLDRKILLRKDGTSVYITQDIGTAILRHDEYLPDSMIYVVGDEQIYHFDVLKLTLQKFGYQWAEAIHHLSYGMVELTTGKMKSREGTVVDADDLMDTMEKTANDMITELGKVEVGTKQADQLAEMVGLAALKYFILKVDPKKNMLFNPSESIDFNGNTGPFIQYTYARICSIISKALESSIIPSSGIYGNTIPDNFDDFNNNEHEILMMLNDYPDVVQKAAAEFSPALIANYVYELSKAYNRFYQEVNILKEENTNIRNMRLMLSNLTSIVIKNSMELLGINVPSRM